MIIKGKSLKKKNPRMISCKTLPKTSCYRSKKSSKRNKLSRVLKPKRNKRNINIDDITLWIGGKHYNQKKKANRMETQKVEDLIA